MTFLKHKGLADVYGKMIKEGFGTTTPTYPGAISATSTTPAASATPPSTEVPSNATTDDPVLGILELIKAGKIDSTKLADALKKHMEQSSGTQPLKPV